jgi:agmatine deiminase
VWLAWPATSGDAERDDALREDCLDLATLISEVTDVTLLANPDDVADASLRSPAGVKTVPAVHRLTSLRAAAPLYLVDSAGAPVGGLLGEGEAGRLLLQAVGLPVLPGPSWLAAGAVECDGAGTVLASERALLERAGLARAVAEHQMGEWLGAERVVWLATPEDEAAVTRVARLVGPGTVAAVEWGDNCARLSAVGLTVVALPSPRRHGAWASYADCLMMGNDVVVPRYGEACDNDARGLLAAALPGRNVTSYPVGILGGLGSLAVVEPALGAEFIP